MQFNLLGAIAARFFTDRIEFFQKNKKPLIIAGVALLATLVILWVRGGSSKEPVRKQVNLRPLTVTDPNGDVWVLELIKGQSLTKPADSDVNPGPPLIVKTDIRKEAGAMSIGLIVEGQLGEQYVGGVMKNKQWQAPPAFTITDLNGYVLARGRFKYG